MSNVITVSSRKMLSIDVFLNENDIIIGYQLGQETLNEFAMKSPFPDELPKGTKATLPMKVYGRLEYLFDTQSKQHEIVKYEAYDDILKTEVAAKLKAADDKGICVSYSPMAASEVEGCSNCLHKTICP